MRTAARGWPATSLGAAGTAVSLLAAAGILGGAEQVAAVGVALALCLGVIAFSLPVLAAMGIAPNVAFLVAMSTYALQVLLGAVLLREGRPGGALDGVLDPAWLGVSLISLALAVTCGVVLDQLRSARSVTLAERAPADSPQDDPTQSARSQVPPSQ